MQNFGSIHLSALSLTKSRHAIPLAFYIERIECEPIDHQSRRNKIVWRKCWSLDLDEDKEDSSFECQSHKKGRNFIGKIKRRSSNIFRSFEEDFDLNLNKGKFN